MTSQQPENDTSSIVDGIVSRRQLLAVGGVVAIGGLSGCVSRVAARTTNIGASPAAMFGGVRGDGLIPGTARETIKFSPTVRVEERFISGDVELEAWMTNTTMAVEAENYRSVRSNPNRGEAGAVDDGFDDEDDDVISPANDYNSVRSNKRRSAFAPADDEDDEDDGDDEDEAHSDSIRRLQRLTGASEDEIRELYEYLEGEPVLGERCVITLPDARAPRGGPSIESLITPKRVIDFVTGRADGDGNVYSWGSNHKTAAAVADEDDEDADDEDGSCEQHSSGGGLSAEQSVYCWGGNTSQTNISGPTHTYGSLDVLTSDSGVVVINVTNRPPAASDTKSMVGVSSDGRPTDVDSLDEWGRESGPASSTSVIVCQVLVQPVGCPCPFPALLHVQRHTNNNQYVYSCGWVIDESCLYENSVTALAGGGGGNVRIQDITLSRSGEVSGDEILRLLPDDVSPVGAQLFFGHLEDAVITGSLLDDELVEEVAGAVSSDGDVYCSCHPLDGHCLHLVDDGNTSDTVKFKAGAELSKSVN